MLAWQYLTTADQRIKLAKRVLSLYGDEEKSELPNVFEILTTADNPGMCRRHFRRLYGDDRSSQNKERMEGYVQKSAYRLEVCRS